MPLFDLSMDPQSAAGSPKPPESSSFLKNIMSWSFFDKPTKALYEKEMLRSQSDIGFTIAKSLFQNEGKNKNVVFSPLSIHILLSLIASGASGPTLDQLLSFLKSNSVDQLNQFASQMVTTVMANGSWKGGPRVSFANGLWVNQSLPLKPSFERIVRNDYKATLSQVDFRTKGDEVVSEVNSWATKSTNGLITDILSRGSVNSTTEIILANALYFKGTWEQGFDTFITRDDKFYLHDGTTVEVPYMTNKEKQYVAAYDGFKVLALPYKQWFDFGRQFSMYIFLPDAKDGLPSLIEKIDSKPGFIDDHIPREMVLMGEFKVPKFKFSFGVDATNVLKKLGLELPFCEGGLLEMVDSKMDQYNLISNIFHKSYIEVNEKTTEAAAASAFSLGGCAMKTNRPKRMDFVADHPFLFAIREDVTGTLAFVGQLLNPHTVK